MSTVIGDQLNREEFIRPSALPAIAICNGRPLMEARVVAMGIVEEDSAEAMMGTIGHQYAEQMITMIYAQDDAWLNPADCMSDMQKVLNKLDPWTADASRKCVSYVHTVVDEEIQLGRDVKVLVEVKLSGKPIDIPRGGTADVIIVSVNPDNCMDIRVHVIDHKLGFLDQGTADDHSQLDAYGVMALHRYKASEVVTHLAQGRVRSFTLHHYTRKALLAKAKEIKATVALARTDAPELNPHINACRYCKALPLCRAARSKIMKANEELALFGVEPEDRVKLVEDRKLAMRFEKTVKQLVDGWKKEARCAN